MLLPGWLSCRRSKTANTLHADEIYRCMVDNDHRLVENATSLIEERHALNDQMEHDPSERTHRNCSRRDAIDTAMQRLANTADIREHTKHVEGSRRHTLDEYRRHVDMRGTECVLETASEDLDRKDLGELAGYIDHLERTARFRNGRWQETRPIAPQRCLCPCGLDLPTGSRPDRQFKHESCRRRYAAAQETPSPA
jgi:hypothetical protein